MSQPGLIDSHCHVNLLDEPDAALDRARACGIRGFLVPAIKLADAEPLLELCARHDDVWCALGVHPHEAATWQDGDDRRLAELLREPKAVAVGECGLDFHYDLAPRAEQFRAVRQQWQLAIDLDLPVVVHNRDSNQEMLELVARPEFASLKADFHSFAGGLEMARDLLARGFYLGMTGMITFPKADNVREVLPETPHDRLLVETDTPYLAPVPHRGKRNQPAFVVEVLERLAQELGLSVAEAVQQTHENFFRLFSRARRPGPETDGQPPSAV